MLTASAVDNPSIDVVVDVAVRNGFDAVSLWPGAGYGRDERDRRVVEDAGLFVWDVDAVIVWVGDDDPGGPYFEEAPADEVYAAAERLGARAVNALLIGPRDATSLDSCVAAVNRAAARAFDIGMLLTVEFARSTAVRDLHQANTVVDAADATNVGILLDTWHHHWSGVLDAPLDRVRAIQLSDAPEDRPDDFAHATRHRREVPGTGSVDFTPILRGAPADTPLIVEVFNTPLLAQTGVGGFAHLLGNAARAVRAAAQSG